MIVCKHDGTYIHSAEGNGRLEMLDLETIVIQTRSKEAVYETFMINLLGHLTV